jgi:hypothetical protein
MLKLLFNYCFCQFSEAFMKNYQAAKTADVEELIGETLNHAPAKPGGTRYNIGMENIRSAMLFCNSNISKNK